MVDTNYHSCLVYYRVNRNGRRGTQRMRNITVKGQPSESSAISQIKKYEKSDPKTDEILIEGIERIGR